ncbi:MAG: chemotaxis protein CheW [Spirochaetia bacterium]|nr:chemotaxis protein CheW [Spirochaetia bacterium]
MSSQKQLLTWRTGNQRYALPLESCREVKELATVYHLPHAPPYVLGVANLRGDIVTVVDLQKMMEPTSSARLSDVSILVRVKHNEQHVALCANALTDIVSIDSTEPPPASLTEAQRLLVSEVIHVAGEIILILNPSEILRPR